MNRDDIIKMARQAHHELITQDYPGHAGQLDPWTMRLLERFASIGLLGPVVNVDKGNDER
jgi:hypothetical protein